MPVPGAMHQSIRNGKHSDDEKLLRPAQRILDEKKDPIWFNLAAVYNAWYNIPKSKSIEIAELMQDLSSSLILLDRINESDKEFKAGDISAGNYVLYVVLDRILTWKSAKAIEIFKKGILRVFRSRGIEFNWRDTKNCPTTSEYYTAIDNSSLLPMLPEFLSVFSAVNPDLTELTTELTRYLRIRNDYLNASDCLSNDEIFGYPVVYAIGHTSHGHSILQALRKGFDDKTMQEYYKSLVLKSGALDATRANLDILSSRLCDTGNKHLESFMDQMQASCDVNTINQKTNNVSV